MPQDETREPLSPNNWEEVTSPREVKNDAEEIQQTMPGQGSNPVVTYAIIGINILVFILMAVAGAGIFDSNGLVHIKWGSNYSPLTLSGDWWRLVTNIFIHFGIIHIVMNMITLYQVGVYLEPMLGKVKFALAYLCTGVLASLTSLWWHKDAVNSAGASGAVFGMYGVFLALLTTDLIPKKVRDSLLKSIGFFVVYNLAYGMKGGIDNAAHIGGLVSGFIIGYLYVLMLKAERDERKINWGLPVVILATVGISYSYLSKNAEAPETRAAVYTEISNSTAEDADKYSDAIKRLGELEKTANAVMGDTLLNEQEMLGKLKTISAPAWDEAERIAEGMQKMKISESQKEKAGHVLEYILLRKQELDAAYKVLEHKTSGEGELNNVRQKIDSVLILLQKT